nr:MAG TPA_asm: stabilization protein [Caudoviricetes sp.]
MQFPTLTEQGQSREMISTFAGYDHNRSIAANAFYDMKNMSSDGYPLLQSRARRGVVRQMETPQGILAKDAMAWADGGKLYYNGAEIMGLTLTEGEKQLVSMGAYLLIWPDKKYLNTKDLTDFGGLEASYASSGTVTYLLCGADGSPLSKVSATKPEEPKGGEYWIDTTQTPHSLMMWSESSEMWIGVTTVYTKIQAVGIGKPFREGDGVEISGAAYGGDSDVVQAQFEELNGTKIIYAKDEDYIVVVGLIDLTYEQTEGTVTVKRAVPDMDYVCEAQNRIWGCKYGMVDGKAVNELYCCKLGDFRNWRVYAGISTDAWAASVGSDGAWTGCANYLGYPTFFKENVIHRIAISSVGAHQVTETVGRGVQSGSSKSLCVVNEVLYYKAREGVCAYDGSFPSAVGEALGDVRYHNAVGGGCGGKYYLSMQDGANAWHLFCYDTARGLWHREDDLHALCFTQMDGELYAIDAETKQLLAMHGSQGTPEAAVKWAAETGLIGYTTVEQKYVSRFNLRMLLPKGAKADMYIQYDSDGVWHHCGHMVGVGTKSFLLPVRPRRCDHFRMRIEGEGDVRVYSFAKILETGSDV